MTKDNPGLTKVIVGLGWDVNAFDTGGAFDLDAAAFLTGASGKITCHLISLISSSLKGNLKLQVLVLMSGTHT